jgi:hypothetical protein
MVIINNMAGREIGGLGCEGLVFGGELFLLRYWGCLSAGLLTPV